MTNELQQQGQRFAELVGLEIKGAIASNGFTQAQVADRLGHSRTAFGRWLKGMPPIAVEVLYNICSVIGANPQTIVGKAYDRLREEESRSEVDKILNSELQRSLAERNTGDIEVSAKPAAVESEVFAPFASQAQMQQFVQEVIVPKLKENDLYGLAAEKNPNKSYEAEDGADW